MGASLDVSVVVSTFGDESWKEMAQEAIASAEMAGAKEVIYNHGETLHGARNAGLFAANCEYVVHLDADDYLSLEFIKEASKASADIRVPAICYSYDRNFDLRQAIIPKTPGHHHICVPSCLEHSNYIIVGAMARTEVVQKVGGWKDYEALEDYDLWQRCWLAGATFEDVPTAIYLARVRLGSRNKQEPRKMREMHYQICSTNMPDKDWSWLLQ